MAIRLPTYSSQGKAPRVSGSTLVEHPEYLVPKQANVGGFLKDMGNVIGEYAYKKEAARQSVEKINLEAELIKDMEQHQDEQMQRPDYQNIKKDTNEKIKTLTSKYKGMVQNEGQWKLYEPKINLDMARLSIKSQNIADKKMFDAQRVHFHTNVMPAIQKMYINSATPEEREMWSNKIKTYAEELESVGILNPGETVKVVNTFGKASDHMRLDKIAETDPDRAEQMLLNQQENFPSFDDADVFKAEGKIDRARTALQRKADKDLKDKYAQGHQELRTIYRDYLGGKHPNIERTINEMYNNDHISEGVWNTYSDKVFNRNQTLSHKMTPQKWKVFDALENEILKDDSQIKDHDDLYNNDSFQSLPEGKQNVLHGLITKSGPIKQAISRGNKLIESSFRMSGIIDPLEKDDIRTEFQNDIAGLDDPAKIHEIARKISTEMGSTSSMLEPDKTKDAKGKTQEPTKFDKAKIESQGLWLDENAGKIKDALSKKPSGVYPLTIKGSGTIYVTWDAKKKGFDVKERGQK
jgi:hypothetical protein